MPDLRVVVADDSFLLRAGVVALIGNEPGISVIAECGSLPDLLAAVAADPPDVVLTDIRMPPGHTDEGIQAAQRFRRSHPNLAVVVLSQYVDAEYALAVVEDGSAGRGYLLKERISDAIPLVAAIRAVAAGDSVIDPRVVDAVLGRDPVARVPGLDRLTARETEVMQCIAAGQSNAAIAAVLSVTDRAVEKHINSIFSKLDLPDPSQVHRRVAAVLVFLSRPPSSLRRSGRRPGARR